MQRKDPRSGRYPCKAKGRTREAGGTLGKSKKAPAREQQGLLAGRSWIVKPKEGNKRCQTTIRFLTNLTMM